MSPSKSLSKTRFIQLKDFSKRVRDVERLRSELLVRLGDSIFYCATMEELLFKALSQINPVNKYLKTDAASIEVACGKVVDHFMSNKGTKYRVLIDGVESKNSPHLKSNTVLFCEIVLYIDKAPGPIYQELLSLITSDLLDISKLIKDYEAQRCIKDYLKDDKTPTNHRDRITYDFYKRCLSERIEILNCQLYGAKKRALEKARHMLPWLSSISFFTWNDRPYKFALPFTAHYFDSSLIDLSSHRLDEFSVNEAELMQGLYGQNKVKFYQKYFKKKPIAQHFNEFDFYLSHLPYLAKRKSLFAELVTLFKAKRWIGFYALALPQVEGLFSEMCNAVSAKDLSQKGLPVKVKEVRPYHVLSDSYFDYYEYHIPLQRNKFAHTGYDEDFKLKSYDLLVDITHLLKVFYELDNPLVKIIRLHRTRDFTSFITIDDFSRYFKLRELLSPAQKMEINDEAKVFENEFLPSCSVDYTCYQMVQSLPEKLGTLNWNINRMFAQHGFDVDVNELTKPSFNTLLSKLSAGTLEELSDLLRIERDNLELLQGYDTFLTYYKKYLPSLDVHVKTELEKLKKQCGTVLSNCVEAYSDIQDRASK